MIGMRTAIMGALGLMVAVAGVQVSLVAGTGSAEAASSTFEAPVYAGDFPDPSFLLVGGVYWAYSTGSAGRNLQVMSSPDLRSWSAPVDPLPVLPAWASPGSTWAPGVIRLHRQYVMYYTVRDTALAMQCISVATSATPGARSLTVRSSRSSARALMADLRPQPIPGSRLGQSVPDLEKRDNSIGQKTHIWAQGLTTTGVSFTADTSPSLLLSESEAWQSPTVEGPTMIRHGTTYYLFYGANNYDTANSGIGYAASISLLGPDDNQSRAPGPGCGSARETAQGPQGPMAVPGLLRRHSLSLQRPGMGWSATKTVASGRYGSEPSASTAHGAPTLA